MVGSDPPRGTRRWTGPPTASAGRWPTTVPTRWGVLVLEGHERDELHRPEAHAHGHRHEQHRLLQPHLTRSLRRRSGDSLRSRRRHVLLPRGGGHRRHHPLGLERPGDPPDLLPPRPRRRAQRRAPVLRRPPPDQLGPLGRRAGWASTSAPTSRSSNTMAREIIHAGLAQRDLHRPGHVGLRGLRRLGRGVDAGAGRGRDRRARRRSSPSWPTPGPRADRAQLCWTLGITEHHNGVDNVLALINLALLCGHVGRYGCGLNPLRGQNNVQGGGDMGAIPNKLPGFQDILDDEARPKFDAAWGSHIPPRYGLHLTAMFEAMEHGELRALYVIGENPAQSEAESEHAVELLEQPRPPRRAGHLPHPDRGAGRRRAAGHARRGARPRARSRTASAGCSGCGPGARAARGRPRRHRDPRRDRPPARPRLDVRVVRGGVGRAAQPLADARRDVVPPARGARRHPVAVLRRRTASSRRTCTAGCGPRTRPSGAARRRSRSSSTSRRSTRSTPTSRCGSRPAAGSTRTTPGCSRVASPPRCASARPSTCRRRTPSASAIEPGEQVRVSSRRGTLIAPVRIDPGAAPRPGLHDDALPRRDRHQHADDRGHRSQVGDGRVQGLGRPGREARSRSPRPAADAGWTCTSSTPVRATTSAPRSTPCSARPRRAGREGSGRRRTPTWPSAGGRPPRRSGRSCCPSSTRSTTASAG